MNNITIDGNIYKCIDCFECNQQHKNNNCKIASGNDKFPIPVERNSWSNKNTVIEKLSIIENMLISQHSIVILQEPIKCLLCGDVISNFIFLFENYCWYQGLRHYIKKHNIKPSSKFISYLMSHDPENINKCVKSTVMINGVLKHINNFSYIKLRENQIHLLDAVFEHGSYRPRYKEKHIQRTKFSEHLGALDIRDHKLHHVAIFGTDRVVKNDPEIYMADAPAEIDEYEYIFHTHPSTPTPGGRVLGGILYELPSTNDLNHFIIHFNNYATQGSIVVAPEGLYIIRKYHTNKEQIKVPHKIFKLFAKLKMKLQLDAIDKYGTKFTQDFFYETIAQDMTVINTINDFLIKYDLYIDYYPRQKNYDGDWVIGSIYLPICTTS